MNRRGKEKQKSPSSNATNTQRTQNYNPYLYNPSVTVVISFQITPPLLISYSFFSLADLLASKASASDCASSFVLT